MSKRVLANEKIYQKEKNYELTEAVQILKKATVTKFDQTVEMQLKLTADPNSSDQVIRGTTSLPFGTGKSVRVVVISKDESGRKAKDAGALEVGGNELIEKIAKGWLDFDVVVAHPNMMKDIAKLGRVLGPKGLMPSPKAGTVTEELGAAVEEIKKGRIEYKMDKQQNLHAIIGKLSFDNEKLVENGRALIKSVLAAKPKNFKGALVKGAHMSSTMGPGVRLNLSSIAREEEADNE